MTSLREARKKGRLDQFIREHEKDAPGDMDKLYAALKRPSRETGKSDQEASTLDSPDD